MALGLLIGALRHRFEGFASVWLSCPLALRFGCGPMLALRLGFRLSLGLSPLHGGFNRGQALLTAR